MKLRIVFMGTPEFALPSLAALIDAGYDIAAVVTAPDKPVGRKQTIQPTPVKKFAKDKKLNVLTPRKIEEIKKALEDIAPDLIVVSAYGKILPSWTLELPAYGALNVHPSLLPRWRGASPIQFVILEGDKKTGVTIMQMNERMDEGPILAQREWKTTDSNDRASITKITSGDLSNILSEMGAELLIETLPKWIKKEITPVSQNDEETTYSHMLTKEDGRIIWVKSAEYIERQIRAFSPWPGTFCYIERSNTKDNKSNRLLLRILEGSASPENIEIKEIGKVFKTTDGHIAAQTGSGLLIFGKVQLEGRKPISIEEFIHGYPDFIGTILR